MLNDYFLYFLSGHLATIEFLEEINPPQAKPSKNLNINNNVNTNVLSVTYIDMKNSAKRINTKAKCKTN